MRLSVNLLTWNGEKYIPQLFASLKKQTFKDFKLNILDNHSSDKTVELIRKELSDFDIEYSFGKNNENIGFARGHNFLYKKSSDCEYVACLNQDLVLAPDCFEKLINCLEENSDTAVVAPRLMKWNIDKRMNEEEFSDEIDSLGLSVFRNRRVVEWYGGLNWEQVCDFFKNQSNVEVFGVSGTLPVFRRSAAEYILDKNGNLFDPDFNAYKEDIDIAYRLRSAGFQARVVLETVAFHKRTADGAKRIDDFSSAKNKAKQSDFVVYHSYKNHLSVLYKNEYWQNLVLDFPFILWYEWKKFLWYLTHNKKVLGGLKENWSLRKIMKARKKEIKKKRKINWLAMRKWLAKH